MFFNYDSQPKIEKKIEFTIVTKTIMYIGIKIVNNIKNILLILQKEIQINDEIYNAHGWMS